MAFLEPTGLVVLPLCVMEGPTTATYSLTMVPGNEKGSRQLNLKPFFDCLHVCGSRGTRDIDFSLPRALKASVVAREVLFTVCGNAVTRTVDMVKQEANVWEIPSQDVLFYLSHSFFSRF